MNESKQYDIPKRVVIEAYQKVKANNGSAGIDGINFQKFEEKLNNNLYKIWNRMSSGSYFPQPVMAVEIPKKSGGVRRLGIPTITDRIAQMVARMYVERAVEPLFCDDSYGYRLNKSALDAVEMTRKRCWRYDYVIELWAMSKYKSLRGHRRKTERWLETVRKREPKLFAHWNRLYTYC